MNKNDFIKALREAEPVAAKAMVKYLKTKDPRLKPEAISQHSTAHEVLNGIMKWKEMDEKWDANDQDGRFWRRIYLILVANQEAKDLSPTSITSHSPDNCFISDLTKFLKKEGYRVQESGGPCSPVTLTIWPRKDK
jgi:hypothetical protein